jgi:hypothetical protein
MKLWGKVITMIAGGMVGSALAIGASPLAADAATVCCYRWWGNTTATEQLGANVVKTSPTVKQIDWARVYVAWSLQGITSHIRIKNANSTTSWLASGGTDSWVTLDPSGTLVGAYYGRCWWTYDILPPGTTTLATYCEMKYSN